ncbi:MAG TPA: tRNA adenosine deaminase-associated protein [Sporichthyaceae bacterium]|nr:tRNA adenosine deaminase-associated protein [Sporichthyaceae bacterium]
MGYFAVVLTRGEDGWDTNDIELDEVESLEDLADAMRDTADMDSDGPILLLLEQEDLWFAVVRVDGEDDPRVFVSDRSAIEHSAYAEMLLEAAESEEDALDVDDLDEEEDPDDEDDRAGGVDDGPVGDLEILLDLGTSADLLRELCESKGVLPSEALTTLAERAGAAGALETVR